MENFEYQATVIIPIYNVENYLRNCLDSLVNQTISKEKMEVLMVNDGSPDNSLAICKEYAEKYPNFKVITQENQGVSAARNTGIQNAKGKYLVYLDGDDMLSLETVESVTDFFDAHYEEVEIVTYPIVYRRKNGDGTHWRYETMNKTGVYDLEKQPYIPQTTMNICVKNKRKETVLFDVTMPISEDQTYMTDLLVQCPKLGFCEKGKYYYIQYGSSVSKIHTHPYYGFENTINFFQNLVLKMSKCLKLKKYLECLLLYNLNWRIKGDSLLPYHFDVENNVVAKLKLEEVIDAIDIETILKYPKMDDAYKYYLISKKQKISVKATKEYISNQNQIVMFDDEGILRIDKDILIVVNQCKIVNDKLYILAYLKNYMFTYLQKPTFYAVFDENNYEEIPLFCSQYSCYWTKMHTNNFWAFHFEIDLAKYKNVKFMVELEGKRYFTKFYFSNRQAVTSKLKREYLIGKHYTVLVTENRMDIVLNDDKRVQHAKKIFEKYLLKEKKKQWLVRQYAKKRTDKVIWLYRDSFNSKDNAYHQFKHDFQMNDGIERYYVLNKDKVAWHKWFTEDEKKYLVEFGSKQHKKLFIQADKILTSFIDRSVLVPFDVKTIEYYWDMFNFEVVYLQHGVMHAKIPNMYSKEKVYMIDKVVVSTKFEKENLINELGYREQDIICTGMPRLDYLERMEKKRKILFAPSWRLYLVDKDNNGHWCARKNFEQTDYFKEVKAFLKSEKLKTMLEKNDYVLDIKLHPNFQVYTDVFESLTDERIKVENNGSIGEYAVCVTDFSSFMYECMYLDIPVILNIFDKEKFKAGLHSYREFFWDLEAFPYYAKTDVEVTEMIEKFLKNTDEIQGVYKDYVNEFYLSRENNHAEKLYEALIKE